MKKYRIFSFLFTLAILSCNSNVKTNPDTNKDKVITTDKEYDTSKLEPYYIINNPNDARKAFLKYNKASFFCEALSDSNFSTKIEKPINLVVNKAGTEVFVINGACLTNSNYYKDCFTRYIAGKKVVPRNFIYKITSDKKVEIVKINNEPPVSCNLGYELGIDKEDNLYISNWNNHGIYKITADKKELTLLDEFKYSNEYNDQHTSKPEYDGPIKLFVGENTITYYIYHPDAFSSGGGIEKTTTLEGKEPFLIGAGINSPNTPIRYYYKIINNEKYFFIENSVLIKIPITKKYDKSEFINLGSFKDFCATNCDSVFSEIKMNSKKELFLNYNHKKILKLNPETKEISTFIEDNGVGYKDGDKKTAQFNFISNMCFDGNDNLFVSDTNNNAIRKSTPDGVVSTFYAEKGGI